MRKFYSSKYYKQLPIALQNVFVTAKGLVYSAARNGLQTGALKQKLLEAESMDEEQLRELQYHSLVSLVTHAFRNVPYYRNKFAEIGFHPGDFKSLDDLASLPFTTKEIVRDNYSDLFALNYRGKSLVTGATSGTSGASLKLKMDSRLIHLERAFAMRQYRWAGFPEKGGRCALLRGDMVVPAEQKTPPFWRYDAWGREMWFSSYHIAASSAMQYVDALERFDPHLIFAFPSAISTLSQFAISAGRKPVLPSLRGILTSSETFFEFEREKVAEVFGTKIFDWYGQFERVIFIGTCKEGRYHVFPDYGVTEFLLSGIDENGTHHHEVVGTGFLNRVMPLIRYRTGDTVALPGNNSVCGCGVHFQQVNAVFGRASDVIQSPQGRQFSAIDLAFKSVAGIQMAQIIQDSLDALTVLVEPDAHFNTLQENKLVGNIRERIGDGMRIQVRQVPGIAPGRNGKTKMIISKLNNNSCN